MPTAMQLKFLTCRLFDLIPASFTGRPTHYIIHAHGAPIQGLLSQALAVLHGAKTSVAATGASQDDSKSSGASACSPNDMDGASDVFVWIDLIALNQNRLQQMNSQMDLGLVRDIIRGCRGGETTYGLSGSF